MLEGLDQGAREASRHRCHEADPVARQARGQEIDGQDESLGQARYSGVTLHHVLVGHDLGSTDVERAIDLGRQISREHEIAEHVADRDGLSALAHPAGGDHGGQTLGEIAQHFE